MRIKLQLNISFKGIRISWDRLLTIIWAMSRM